MNRISLRLVVVSLMICSTLATCYGQLEIGLARSYAYSYVGNGNPLWGMSLENGQNDCGDAANFLIQCLDAGYICICNDRGPYCRSLLLSVEACRPLPDGTEGHNTIACYQEFDNLISSEDSPYELFSYEIYPNFTVSVFPAIFDGRADLPALDDIGIPIEILQSIGPGAILSFSDRGCNYEDWRGGDDIVSLAMVTDVTFQNGDITFMRIISRDALPNGSPLFSLDSEGHIIGHPIATYEIQYGTHGTDYWQSLRIYTIDTSDATKIGTSNSNIPPNR